MPLLMKYNNDVRRNRLNKQEKNINERSIISRSYEKNYKNSWNKSPEKVI